jgi:hypothetical protein
MSEETPPAKNTARKSVRKKGAAKRAPRKNAKKETSTSEEQLPLSDSATPVDAGNSEMETSPRTESEENPPPRKDREPTKSRVRDARRETADEPIANEVREKLVPDEGPGEEPQRREKVKEPQRDQHRPDQNDHRGRGRGRDRDREQRPEKREPKIRVSVNSKDLAKKAWQIFESEVTEEGLALLDDNGLRDYARSSFNAARLFLEEKSRVVGRQDQGKKVKKNDD